MRRMMRCADVSLRFTISLLTKSKSLILEGEELMENAVVLEDIAWAERYGKNFDWKIFALSEDTPAQVTAPPLFNTLR